MSTRRPRSDSDAVVVGSGPNGLAAAVTLARAGARVTVFERAATPGGGSASAELTVPGFLHDVCSAVHPLAFESRFFREFGLRRRVRFAVPEISFAHPLDGGRAGIAYRDLARTRAALGRDGGAYAALIGPLAERATRVAEFTGSTLLRVPPDPITAVLFGGAAAEQGTAAVWNARFREDRAPAMLTGVAAHTILPLPSIAAAGAGLALTSYAHGEGWPIPIGGSQAIVDALIADLEAHGGELVTDHEVRSLDELPSARAIMLDVTPRALLALAGDRLPAHYRRALSRFRYGSAVAKVDFALSDPVPWTYPGLSGAGTLHLGGTRQEIAAVGERGRARSAQRLALRPRVAALAVRRLARAGGQAHPVGVHPRAGRIAHRPAGGHHPSDRAVRPRLPRHDSRQLVAHRAHRSLTTTRITSGATSPPASRTSGRC